MILSVSSSCIPLRWTFAAACGVAAFAALGMLEKAALAQPAANSREAPLADRRPVELRFVGSDNQAPLSGVEVKITQGYGADQKEFGPFTTGAAGTIRVRLPIGFYSLHLSSEEELRYLPVEALWNQKSRGPQPDLSLSITESGPQKWLNGNRRPEGEEPPAKSRQARRITYRLLPACELVLRAVDAESGEGLASARFYTENAVGEEWAHAIQGENLGARPTPEGEQAGLEENVTDADGVFRRLVSANANFKYGVDISPPGYEHVDGGREFEVEVLYGQRRAEHVFKFRRAP